MTDASRSNPHGGPSSEPSASARPAGEDAPLATMAGRNNGRAGGALLRAVGRWWPALLGLTGIVSLIDIEPWQPSDPTTVILPGLAVAYLVLGAVRRQLRRPGVLRLEIVG